MAEITVPIQVNLPDDWIEQIISRLENDPNAEWVKITRCKDCVFYNYKGVQSPNGMPEMTRYCGKHRDAFYEHLEVNPNDFCKWGIMK